MQNTLNVKNDNDSGHEILIVFFSYIVTRVPKLVFCWKLPSEGFSGDTIRVDLRADKLPSIWKRQR